MKCKQKLKDGVYNPLEFLKTISHTIGNVVSTQDVSSSSSEDEGGIDDTPTMGNHRIVCLVPRLETWVFMPCRHANCCSDCCQKIEDLGQTCPVCRSTIDSIFKIYN